MLETEMKDIQERMDKAAEVVGHELDTLRTGRASAHMLDAIKVPFYGTDNPLNQIATVSTPDAHTIMIQPWDKSAVGAIEKAILQANVGLTPNNDGQLIRLNVPQMTEESRKDMVKRAHAVAEDGRIAVRNVRRHINDEIKKKEKDHGMPEDEAKRLHERAQKLTDEHIKRIDELLVAKEKEIMTV